MARQAGRAVRIAVLAALLLPGAASAAAYPEPPPDFSHRGAHRADHAFFFNPETGERDRPLLVVYHEFTDQRLSTGDDELPRRIFGIGAAEGERTVAGYFRAASFGDLVITPARETSGTPNDGVVSVVVGTRVDNDEAWRVHREEPEPLWNFHRDILEATDPFVDFRSFDTNGDGRVGPDELMVLFVAPSRTPEENCGARRGIAGDAAADGVSLAPLHPALGAHLTNTITFVHELAHFGLDLADTYGWGSGRWDLGGPTCGVGESFYLPNAWHRLHWSWGRSNVVVTRDGFYDVRPASQDGLAFILYDPARGVDDYFMVESRKPDGAYDADVPGTGLAIWRVSDTNYFTSSDLRPAVELLRPDGRRIPPACASGGCYGGAADDVWSPSTSSTAARDMTRGWLDGSRARVAVRAIKRANPAASPSDGVWRAYFDVVGPGILVDGPTIGRLYLLADAPTIVRPSVMNTGETEAPFAFSWSGAPPGWSFGAGVASLPASRYSPGAGTRVEPPAGAWSARATLDVRSTIDPLVRGSDEVSLYKLSREVERNERREDATELRFLDSLHQHLDPRVLVGGGIVTDTRAVWAVRTSTAVNLETTLDQDFYRVPLPDLRVETSELAGHPDCEILSVAGPLGAENIFVTGLLTVRTPPFPGHDPTDRLRILDLPSTGGAFERTVACPQASSSPGEAHFSVGERAKGAPRTSPTRYSYDVSYRVVVQRVPEPADWLVAERESRGAKSVLPMPCPGGIFPDCAGGPRSIFDLAHPFDPQRAGGCLADGCPDHYLFSAKKGAGLDLIFAADKDLAFTLLDMAGKQVGQAVPIDQLKDVIQPPGAQQHHDGEVANDPTFELGPPESETRGEFTKRLRAPLAEGLYVLRVSGPEGSFTVDFYSGIHDADADGVPDGEDGCPTTLDAGADLDGDGVGDACDDANALQLELKGTVNAKSKGVAPVAVLGTAGFDAAALDVARACFGDAEASWERDCTEAHGKLHLEDVNGDGRMDAVLHFDVRETGLDPGATSACLSALTADGTPVEGCAAVRVLG